MLPLYKKNPEKILLSSLTCSQIWLNPPVNDHQPTNFTNLRKTKPNKMKQKKCYHGLNKCVCVCVCVCVFPKIKSLWEKSRGALISSCSL